MTSVSVTEPVAMPPERTTQVDVIVPVHNEAHVLADNMRRLHRYLSDCFPFSWRVTVVDNASTDATWTIAQQLGATLPGVRALRLDRKGRGLALRTAWIRSDADVVAYMDVDLSTDLGALLPLVAPLVSGHSDIAIGSRLARGSRVVRGPRRELVSRAYNLLLRVVLRTSFRDAQCGFKAGRADVVRALLPLIENDAWFFDTELLVLAERSGLRIHELPVDWVDDPDSRVDVWRTALEDLKGVWRIVRHPRRLIDEGLTGVTGRSDVPIGLGPQLVRFSTVGLVSTAADIVLYNLLRSPLGPWWANVVALLVTMVGNTQANRTWTFRRGRRHGLARSHAEAGVAFLVGLATSTVALAAVRAAVDDPSRLIDTIALLLSGGVATATRFLLFRHWIFGPSRADPVPEPL
jgi:glycosyltransferase involved in cell wall biosynthesis/putative flippase GtrA